jgi:hypothetical protein
VFYFWNHSTVFPVFVRFLKQPHQYIFGHLYIFLVSLNVVIFMEKILSPTVTG